MHGGDCCEGLLGLVYSRELKDLGFGLGFWTWISGLRACVSGLRFGLGLWGRGDDMCVVL